MIQPGGSVRDEEVIAAAVQDGDKQCRQQVDFIAGPNEPASTRWCRKNPNDKYELELGV
ncbi:hypothetical protein D3C83_41280 [compost metagenome]